MEYILVSAALAGMGYYLSNDEEETLLLKGSVPGPRGATVLIRNAVKVASAGGEN